TTCCRLTACRTILRPLRSSTNPTTPGSRLLCADCSTQPTVPPPRPCTWLSESSLRDRLGCLPRLDEGAQYDSDEPAEQREHEGAQHAGPEEAVDMEAEAEEPRDPAHEKQEQGVDDEGDESECQDV